MNTVDRRSHWLVRVLSSLLLPVLLAAGCAHNSMAEERGEPPSDPRTASPVRLMDDDGTSNLSRDRGVWPAAVVQSHEIEFLCAGNPYQKPQFDLMIVDDLDEDSGIRECQLPPRESQDVKTVLWIVVPALAKIRRDVDYIYETPTHISGIEVRSRPIIRVKVLAFDPRDGSCADGTFETTVPETRFRIPVDSAVAYDSDHPLRHAKEAYSVQLHLSDIHEGARSTLTPHKKRICDALFQNTNSSRWIHNFVALLRLWSSTPGIAIESLFRRIHSPIREMESVVRILGSKPGSGFYIEDPRDGSGDSEESSLVLTNYHLVEHASLGAVRVWTLRYESAHHAWNQGDDWNKGGEERGEEERIQDYFPGTVLFYDEHRDLALVRVLNGGPPLELYKEDPLPPGIHEVLALGHPRRSEFYATKGIVSRIIVDCRDHPEDRDHPDYRAKLPLKCIEHDAATNVGNSGGPLLLLRNGGATHVLGVNVGVRGETFLSVNGRGIKETEHPFPGLSLAIHYEEVRAFLDEFMMFRSSDMSSTQQTTR